VKAFLFDMDGVVVHNMPAHTEAWRRFFGERGIALERREFLERTMGMPTREVLAYYFKRPFEAAEAGALASVKEALYRELYAPKRRCARGLRAFLGQARREGLRVGLGTGSMDDNVAFILDGLALRPWFEAVVTGADVRRGKPDPETFLLLAERLGVAPRDCVVFEDSLLGEEAARRAGMAVVAITTSHEAAEFRGPALSARDFLGLTPAKVRARLDRARGARHT
jgi:beta-phosphoglucomutase family hydrolase